MLPPPLLMPPPLLLLRWSSAATAIFAAVAATTTFTAFAAAAAAALEPQLRLLSICDPPLISSCRLCRASAAPNMATVRNLELSP